SCGSNIDATADFTCFSTKPPPAARSFSSRERTSCCTSGSAAEVSRAQSVRCPGGNSSAWWKISPTFRHCSGVMRESCRVAAVQLAMQPGLCHALVAADGGDRGVQCLRGLFDAQPAEEAQFNHAALAFVNFGQGVERVIERQNLRAALWRE